MAGPLAGARVIEAASFITGPYAGQLLADLGADVVKVEEPRGGDPFRSWGKGLYSPHFIAYNRSKRSVTLDLKTEAGLDVLHRLAGRADVLIENFRPGVADRLGFGFQRLRELNPRLIYCSISGLGQSGPYVKRPTYDTVGQALSGLLSLLVDPVDPRPIGPAFSDGLTGLFAAYGVLAALHARAQTGQGQLVDTSMLAATMTFLPETFGRYFELGEVAGPYTRPKVAQVYAFRCADGHSLAIHLSSPPKFWQGLAAVVGRHDMVADPRFAKREARVDHYDLIRDQLAPIFLTRTRAEWLERLEAADVPVAPINTVDQVLEDPQVRHLGLEQVAQHPTEGAVRMLGFPVRFDTTVLDPSAAAPTLGEHNDAIFAELGLTPQEVQQVKAGAVV